MSTHQRFLTVCSITLAGFVLAAANPCSAAIESRDILKTYFETGDIPTQEQFQDLIDSSLNLIDDGLAISLAVDAMGSAARFDVGAIVGLSSTFLDYTLTSGFSDDWMGQSGFLAFSFVQNSQTHFGYLQISSDVPGATNPYAMSVEYLVYESQPNTPLTTAQVPEPATATLVLVGLGGLGALRGRRRANA